MRKIILSVAVSLDGHIEGPHREYDWCFNDQNGSTNFMSGIDTLFMGRKTYEMSLRQGPIPSFPKFKQYVFSYSLTDVCDGYELINLNVRDRIRQIKQESGKDIWLFGGAQFTSWLANEGLIDEMRIALHPVVLGGGKPLFTGLVHRLNLGLTTVEQYPSGLLMLTYATKQEAEITSASLSTVQTQPKPY
jgi:dihydrofolate reductase